MKLVNDLESQSKLRALVTAMAAEDLLEEMSLEERDDAIWSNGVNGLTRLDLARLIGMTVETCDYDLAYRLAKMLVEQNQP